MASPNYPIYRPRLAGRAKSAIEFRRQVLSRVQFLPEEPGVETYEIDILDALFAQPLPDFLLFDEFGWDFECMSDGWKGITSEYLEYCAAFAWRKIHEMTLL